jgi:hypothetical protein
MEIYCNKIKVRKIDVCEDLDLIDLARGRVQWRDLPCTVVTIQIHKMGNISGPTK